MPREIYDSGGLAKGMTLQFSAEGIHDAQPVVAFTEVQKGGLTPLPPVHFNWRREAGFIHLSWIRRPRTYVAWQDEVDVPLVEQQQRYRLTTAKGENLAEPAITEVSLPIADLALRLAGAAQIDIELRQVGDYAVSQPVLLTIPASALN